MFKLISIFLISYANSYPAKMKVADSGQYKNINVTLSEKLHVSENCVKLSANKCEALRVANSAVKPSITKGAVTGHPASRYCHDRNGVARIMISDENKQYDFCLFADGSMIDSWDLYYKHFPK